MMDRRFTNWFKRIRTAMRLTRRDVVAIMARGGIEISASRADGWMRHEDDDRRNVMSETEFDTFTYGLVEWVSENRKG